MDTNHGSLCRVLENGNKDLFLLDELIHRKSTTLQRQCRINSEFVANELNTML